MKIYIILLVCLVLSGCSGKKLRKNCIVVGPNDKGEQLYECNDM